MDELEAARAAFIAAEARLLAAVRGSCPGTHDPTHHRVGQPSWCPSCGRDNRGRQHASATDMARAKGDRNDETCPDCGHLVRRHGDHRGYWREGPCMDCRRETDKFRGNPRPIADCCALTAREVQALIDSRKDT